jgi:hypothetical protein
MTTARKYPIPAIDLQDVDVLEDGIAPVVFTSLSERVPTGPGGGNPPSPPDTTR